MLALACLNVVNAHDETQDNPQATEHQKLIWLITYASGSPDITVDMLHAGSIRCIECYTITWRESKYTLFRLKKKDRIRKTALERVMRSLETSHGIKGGSITGYDMLSSNTKDTLTVPEHPGFRRIVQLLNENPSEIRAWMEEGDFLSNKQGILWNHKTSLDPKQMTHGQLVERMVKWAPLIEDYQRTKGAHENLMVICSNQENELARLRLELQTERAQCNDFFEQLRSKIRECGDLKTKLMQLGHKVD